MEISQHLCYHHIDQPEDCKRGDMLPMNAALPDFDALWDYDDPEATEQQFRTLLPRAEQSDDRSYHVQLLTQIARAEGLQRKFAEAHATLASAQAQLAADLAPAR